MPCVSDFAIQPAADSITNVLEQCSKLYPELSVRIFYGAEEELLNGLSAGKFDVIFLPENAEIPAHMQYNCKMVSLHYTPVMMKYGGLPIEPIADGHITQKVLWIGEAHPLSPVVLWNAWKLSSPRPHRENRNSGTASRRSGCASPATGFGCAMIPFR